MDIYYIGTALKITPHIDGSLHHFYYPKMTVLKNKLNAYKNIIDKKDPNKWSIFTNKSNPYRELRYSLKSKYNAEMCTNAWLKMHEIINRFKILTEPNSDSSLNTFHLCEAPGAFVSSINHHIKTTKSNVYFNWYAQSLIDPSQKFIGDDYGLLNKYPIRWLYGPTTNGDITNINNILYYYNHFKQSQIDLVTADGGTDCSSDFNNQEIIMGKITFAQILTALATLSDKKHFVIKMFTMFEPTTISLMYLLYCVFDQVFVTKPITSKPCNSEVYVVCLKYKKLPFDYIQNLVNIYSLYCNLNSTANTSMFPMSGIPNDFVEIIYQCQYFYSKRQAINIRYFIEKYDEHNLDKRQKYEIEKSKIELISQKDKKEKHISFINSNNIIPIHSGKLNT